MEGREWHQLPLMMIAVFSQRIWLRYDVAGWRKYCHPIVDACIYDFTIGI